MGRDLWAKYPFGLTGGSDRVSTVSSDMVLNISCEIVEKPQQAQKSSDLEHQNTSLDQNIFNIEHSVKSFFLSPIIPLVFQQTLPLGIL